MSRNRRQKIVETDPDDETGTPPAGPSQQQAVQVPPPAPPGATPDPEDEPEGRKPTPFREGVVGDQGEWAPEAQEAAEPDTDNEETP